MRSRSVRSADLVAKLVEVIRPGERKTIYQAVGVSRTTELSWRQSQPRAARGHHLLGLVEMARWRREYQFPWERVESFRTEGGAVFVEARDGWPAIAIPEGVVWLPTLSDPHIEFLRWLSGGSPSTEGVLQAGIAVGGRAAPFRRGKLPTQEECLRLAAVALWKLQGVNGGVMLGHGVSTLGDYVRLSVKGKCPLSRSSC